MNDTFKVPNVPGVRTAKGRCNVRNVKGPELPVLTVCANRLIGGIFTDIYRSNNKKTEKPVIGAGRGGYMSRVSSMGRIAESAQARHKKRKEAAISN